MSAHTGRPALPRGVCTRRTVAAEQKGFTLVELTIVLVIVALLIGGMLLPLSTQRDIQAVNDTQRQLASINEALLGFSAGQGRMPCPATAISSGQESFCTNATGGCGAELFVVQAHGRCADYFNGFVPAATLGLSPTDGQGFAVDAWGFRLRYAITSNNAGGIAFPFTTPSGIKNAWVIDPGQIQPDLHVCSTASNISNPGAASAACPAADRITDKAVALVFSVGKNGGSVPSAANELANWTNSNDRVFVSATASDSFDDLVVWISPYILYNRLISAGRLP